METLIVGLDIGLPANDVCALNGSGEVVASHRRFANTRSGSAALASWLVEQMEQGSFERLQIGGEGAGLQWFHPFWFLQQSPELAERDVRLYLVNARAAAKFKAAWNEQEKTDVKDAHAIAEWLRFGRLPHPLHLDERFLALQRLTRHRYHLMHSLAREKVYTRQVALYLKIAPTSRDSPSATRLPRVG
jgi:transposase